MNANDPSATNAQRAAARRTAWMAAGIAFLVYAGFILSGVIGR